MKKVKLTFVCALFLVIFGVVACKKEGDNTQPTNPDEQILVANTWRGEGLYVNGVKQPTMPPFSIRFFPEVAGVKTVAINGIPGGTWRLNSTSNPKQLTIIYPSPNFSIENGNSVGVSSVTFNLSALSSTNLNLTSSTTSTFFGIITLSADTELRLIPQ
ncbi:MAG: hypothetical protein NZ551_00015 [Microscillaceae bacterium]|nr:hypothetical protein [Microscillaceae bacterium]MDW8459573.1 hypothetical protein [Cytophagales bacterium]